MGFNFPNAPSVGQLWPQPATPGVPVYRWDGQAWMTGSADTAGSVRYDSAQGLTAPQQLQARQNIAAAAAVTRSYLAGLGMSTPGSSTLITVAPGVAVDSTNADLMTLPAAMLKNYAAWTVGTNGGGVDTGTGAASTWYHLYLIKRPDTGVVDWCFSLSAVAPTFGANIPAAYTLFRRIGPARITAGSVWQGFVQDGDTFIWNAPVADVNAALNPGTAAVTRTLSTPLGVRVQALCTAIIQASTTTFPGGLYLSDLAVVDTAADQATATVYFYAAGATVLFGAPAAVMTNTSSQIRSRMEKSDSTTALYITTNGWIDRRGRDA